MTAPRFAMPRIAVPRIAVIGAGLMGAGIAQVFAHAGSTVRVQDPSQPARASLPERIAEGLRSLGHADTHAAQVTAHATIAEAVTDADLVIEAAPENLELKQRLFADIEAAAPAHAILASNTSVMPITAIMARLQTPARACGTHWWNPATLIPLVEIIPGAHTAPATIDQVFAWLEAAGKTPVRVLRDVPGFIGNRLQHALWREAISLVEHGICDAQTVDTVVKSSFGRRLGVLGPLENADLVGTDLTLAIHRTVLPAIDHTPGPSPYLEGLVAAQKLGFKSGEGFRTWTPEQQATLRSKIVTALRQALETTP